MAVEVFRGFFLAVGLFFGHSSPPWKARSLLTWASLLPIFNSLINHRMLAWTLADQKPIWDRPY